MTNRLEIVMNEWNRVSTDEPELCGSLSGRRFCILGGVVDALMWTAPVLGFLLWLKVGACPLVGIAVLELILYIVRWRIQTRILGCLVIVEARRITMQEGRVDWNWGVSKKIFSKACGSLEKRLFAQTKEEAR